MKDSLATLLRARDEQGRLLDHEPRFMFPVDPDAPNPERRERERAEARRWWEHTRARIAQTVSEQRDV